MKYCNRLRLRHNNILLVLCLVFTMRTRILKERCPVLTQYTTNGCNDPTCASSDLFVKYLRYIIGYIPDALKIVVDLIYVPILVMGYR